VQSVNACDNDLPQDVYPTQLPHLSLHNGYLAEVITS
jgi:hypothetical protein